MNAIERLMRRLIDGVPRVLHALQRGTDITSRLLMFRRGYLMVSGGDVEAADATEEMGSGEWLWPVGVCDPTRVAQLPQQERRLVVYIHGGAFVLCNPATHRTITCNVARATDALVLAVDYRRPPDHPFPLALEDVLQAYKSVLDLFSCENIIVAGESAGGNLALALCLKLRQENLPMPAGLMLVSPWIDLCDFTSPSWNGAVDFISADIARLLADSYAGEPARRHNELVSPIQAEMVKNLPRTLLIYGGAESLSHQQASLGEKLRAAAVDLDEFVGPNSIHGFPIFGDCAYGLLGRALVLICSAVVTLAVVASIVLLAVLRSRSMTLLSAAFYEIAVAVIIFDVVALIFLWLRNACASRAIRIEPARLQSQHDVPLPPPYQAYERMRRFSQSIWSTSIDSDV